MRFHPIGPTPAHVPTRIGPLILRYTKAGLVGQTAPKRRTNSWSQKQKDHRTRFGFAARMAANPTPMEMLTAIHLSHGTMQVPRDLLTAAALGEFYVLTNADGTEWGRAPTEPGSI